MRDGLYSFEFQTPFGKGGGTLHAQRGEVWGGDTIRYVTGTYSRRDGDLHLTLSVRRHDGAGPGPFGVERMDLVFTGRQAGDSVELEGHWVEKPDVKVTATATWVAE